MKKPQFPPRLSLTLILPFEKAKTNTGTAPQKAQADPKQEVYWLTDPENPVTKAPFVPAPVLQTEGEDK